MKKLFFLAIVAMALFTSCKDQQFGFIYSLHAVGDADGNFDIKFNNGLFEGDGKTDLVFLWSNDSTGVVRFDKPVAIQDALNSNNKQVREAALATQDWFEQKFGVAAASGTYYVSISGWVKETLTGITFSVQKTFTNRK